MRRSTKHQGHEHLHCAGGGLRNRPSQQFWSTKRLVVNSELQCSCLSHSVRGPACEPGYKAEHASTKVDLHQAHHIFLLLLAMFHDEFEHGSPHVRPKAAKALKIKKKTIQCPKLYRRRMLVSGATNAPMKYVQLTRRAWALSRTEKTTSPSFSITITGTKGGSAQPQGESFKGKPVRDIEGTRNRGNQSYASVIGQTLIETINSEKGVTPTTHPILQSLQVVMAERLDNNRRQHSLVALKNLHLTATSSSPRYRQGEQEDSDTPLDSMWSSASCQSSVGR